MGDPIFLFFTERHGSGDDAPCAAYPGTDCSVSCFHLPLNMDGAIRNPRPRNKDTSAHPAAQGMRGTAVALPSSRGIILTGSGDAINTPINPARSSVAPIILNIFVFVIIF